MIPARPLPDFRSPEFLRAHLRDTMAFYLPRAIDPSGGLFHFFRDNGEVYDRHTRHLVSSTRFVVTCAMAQRLDPNDLHRQALKQAFDFLQVHHDPTSGGYAWLLDRREGRKTVLDATNHAYGLAFVLLAHAHAHMAGLSGAHAGIAQTFNLLEQRFWEPQHCLYADEATTDWHLSPCRGQNANMHLCEALLAAFDGKARFWADYQRLWAYAWEHFVDHEHGAWWRILRADNSKISDEKSPAGKVDYHTMGACHDVIDSITPLRR